MRQKKKATEAAPIPNLNKGKNTECIRDKQIVYRYLYEEPRTRAQVADATGIWINSVCLYVGGFLKEGKAKVHHKGICPVKHSHGVEFVTTNPALFPQDRQLSLFDYLWKGGKK